MDLKLGLWYKVIYKDETSVIFRFVGTTQDGKIMYELCDGTTVYDLLDKPYVKVILLGENCPC